MIFYTIIYFVVCNWIQIIYLLGNILKPKQKILTLNNKELISKYKIKTGLTLSIKIINEERLMIGFMISSPPFKPIMIFSSKLYQAFNKDEMDWVILHESGHYLMWHNYKLAFTQLTVFLAGILLYVYIKHMQIFFLFVFGMLLPIFYFQLAKIFEYQADYYAVAHMNNPKGMITGNIKMKEVNSKKLETNPIFKKLFVIAVSYEERIKMAKKEIKLRKLN